MAKKNHSSLKIIRKLREAEVGLAKGQTTAQICKAIGVTQQTYYRWRREYGGLTTDQAKRLKELEKENARLKKLLADPKIDLVDICLPTDQHEDVVMEALAAGKHVLVEKPIAATAEETRRLRRASQTMRRVTSGRRIPAAQRASGAARRPRLPRAPKGPRRRPPPRRRSRAWSGRARRRWWGEASGYCRCRSRCCARPPSPRPMGCGTSAGGCGR